MTDALSTFTQPLALLEVMRRLEQTRTRDVIVAVLDAVEDVAHLGGRPVELGVLRQKERRQVVGREVPERTSVRVLRARLVLRQDLLAATRASERVPRGAGGAAYSFGG